MPGFQKTSYLDKCHQLINVFHAFPPLSASYNVFLWFPVFGNNEDKVFNIVGALAFAGNLLVNPAPSKSPDKYLKTRKEK